MTVLEYSNHRAERGRQRQDVQYQGFQRKHHAAGSMNSSPNMIAPISPRTTGSRDVTAWTLSRLICGWPIAIVFEQRR